MFQWCPSTTVEASPFIPSLNADADVCVNCHFICFAWLLIIDLGVIQCAFLIFEILHVYVILTCLPSLPLKGVKTNLRARKITYTRLSRKSPGLMFNLDVSECSETTGFKFISFTSESFYDIENIMYPVTLKACQFPV